MFEQIANSLVTLNINNYWHSKIGVVKYFFLSDGWTYDRIWEFGGLWDQVSWGRKPEIKRLNCGIEQQQQILWLYAVEDEVLMVEVRPEKELQAGSNIGQVVLKRLISAEQAIEILHQAESVFNSVTKDFLSKST
jgi:hypothetical protein